MNAKQERSEIMIVAGEASGDLHGSNLVREIKSLYAEAGFYGIGGERMSEQGVHLIYHINELSFMGFSEVIKNISLIRSVERTIQKLLDIRRPRAVVLIDFPGMNLRIARYAKERGIPVAYYIAPQVWAWGRYRLKKMRKYVDRAFVILPFEEEYFRNEGIDAEFIGHPILDLVKTTEERDAFCSAGGLDPKRRILALFPGSRAREVVNHASVMARAALRLRDEFGIQPVIGVSRNLRTEFVQSLLPDGSAIPLLQGATYTMMRHADAAFVKSGTSTLEAACFMTPMLVVYKTSVLNYLVGRLIVNLNHFSLVNILAGEEIVKELSQGNVNANTLYEYGRELIVNEEKRETMKRRLQTIRSMLGQPGASKRAAEGVLAVARISVQK
jgi:lipid-A-disaccharide synthase